MGAGGLPNAMKGFQIALGIDGAGNCVHTLPLTPEVVRVRWGQTGPVFLGKL